MTRQKFVPKNKMSKKARRAENAAGREKWGINPITRRKESGKKYDRRKFKRGESE